MTASATEPQRSEPAAVGTGRSLLDLDPELGQLLTPDRRAAAQRELRARITSFPVGEWDGGRLSDADPTHLGLLLVDGVLAREVVLSDTVSTELLGPGDIVRPWHLEGPPQLLRVTIRWNVLAHVRLALIDRRVAALLGRYPEIGAVITDRLSERAQRLAITQAISQLNRVDRRLLALFWHLAERWGRVARDGIAVPLALSHRLIGELVGARRPTVSTALAELARTGQLVRRDDGTWLLTGEPLTDDPPGVGEVIRQRRRLTPAPAEIAAEAREPEPEHAPAAHAAGTVTANDARLAELRASMAIVRAESERQLSELTARRAELSDLRERTQAERAKRLEALRAAAARR